MKNNSSWDIFDWLLLGGGIWLITKIFKSPTQAGISGLHDANRFFYSYHNAAGTNIFKKDMVNFSKDEITQIIQLIIKGRTTPVLSVPIYKGFKGYEFDGELRDVTNGWRIFVKKFGNDLIMLSVFKKDKNKTPQNEIDKANQRAKEWQTHTTLVRKPTT